MLGEVNYSESSKILKAVSYTHLDVYKRQIIGNEAILSEELEKIKDYLINHFNSSFYDLASEKINLPLVSQKYYNKLDLEERRR